MGNRYSDWFRQAEADLRHARHALEHRDFEWSCFASHQAAEKALKSVFKRQDMDPSGHTLTVLVSSLPGGIVPASELADYVRCMKNFVDLKTGLSQRFQTGLDKFFRRRMQPHAEAHPLTVTDFAGNAMIDYAGSSREGQLLFGFESKRRT